MIFLTFNDLYINSPPDPSLNFKRWGKRKGCYGEINNYKRNYVSSGIINIAFKLLKAIKTTNKIRKIE